MVASLIQLKCTKYFHDDLTLVFEDAQCFSSYLRTILRDMKNYNLGQKFVERYIKSYIFDIYCQILYEIVSPPGPPIQC